jgi:hypothetical protein
MKKSILGFGALALALGAIGLTAIPAFAYRGNPTVNGPNYTVERHAAMESAFDKLDYSAWKNLMGGRGRVTQVVNETNFAKFAEAHKLAERGKLAEANAIRAELGLGQGGRDGYGLGRHGSQ